VRNKGFKALLRDRRAISTAIVYVLIIVISIAAAAAIGGWIMYAGSTAARKAAIEVVGQPMISIGAQTLSFTVNNVGRADATIVNIKVAGVPYTSGITTYVKGEQQATLTIPRGERTTIEVANIDVTGWVSGDIKECQLVTDQGTVSFMAQVTE